jgi:hypothetical protein
MSLQGQIENSPGTASARDICGPRAPAPAIETVARGKSRWARRSSRTTSAGSSGVAPPGGGDVEVDGLVDRLEDARHRRGEAAVHPAVSTQESRFAAASSCSK